MNAADYFLLAEDNPQHAKLVGRVIAEAQPSCEVKSFQDGAAVLEYLFQLKNGTAEKLPLALILDLNLPKLSGHEVLESIKQDAFFKTMPVIILSSSDHTADVTRAYNQHANSYLVKPMDFGAFQVLIQDVVNYWGNRNFTKRV